MQRNQMQGLFASVLLSACIIYGLCMLLHARMKSLFTGYYKDLDNTMVLTFVPQTNSRRQISEWGGSLS